LSCINYNKYKCKGKVVLKGNSCELTTGHTCDNYVKNKQGKIIKGKNNIYFKISVLKRRDRTIRQWTIRQWKIRQWTIRQWSDNPSVDNPSVNKFVIPTHILTTMAKNFHVFVGDYKRYRKFGD